MHCSRYTIDHETLYTYSAPVAQSWQLARLTPSVLPWQRTISHSLQIDPPAHERHETLDSFGNTVTHFNLYEAHRLLRVHMRAVVEIGSRPAHQVREGQPWESVRLAVSKGGQDLHPAQMSQFTSLLPRSEAAFAYAQPSLIKNRDWYESVLDLMHRIHADFEFNPETTTVSTSVDEVLHQRSGVCQDFAHLMLACLRGHGLPARYVSGYLLTDPPPGQERLMGVDASHAWVAAYSPQDGWVELDPTNNQLADHRYITLAWGADFADVVPLRGVILGGGQQLMQVKVSVLPSDHHEFSSFCPTEVTRQKQNGHL